MDIKIGDTIKASTYSTSGRDYTVSVADMTAEVDLKGNTGQSSRVPCVLGVDRHGDERLLILIYGGQRWVVSGHRIVVMLREVEGLDGELVSGALKERVDAALTAAEQ